MTQEELQDILSIDELHELLMNAAMHRDYQANMPIRLYQYDRHIEIMNPGGLYGQARPENFPNVNDYRNNVVAELMRTFNYVNMFNHGVIEVRDALKSNDNPPAEFNINLLTAFSVIIRDEHKTYDESISDVESDKMLSEIWYSLNLLEPRLRQSIKSLIISLEDQKLSTTELKLKPELKPKYGEKSSAYIMKNVVTPSIKLGLVAKTHPDNPRHPHQKYYLTTLGKSLLSALKVQP